MTDKPLFDLFRAKKRQWRNEPLAGLTDAEVKEIRAALHVVLEAKAPPALQPQSAFDADSFFAGIRSSFGGLKQDQVDGFNALLAAMRAASWPVGWAAYGLATAWHETAFTMQPVEEAYWLSDAWRKANLRYYPWHGRGFVQLTWEYNYRKADEELKLGEALLKDPAKAMDCDIAAKILVRGMAEGWFTKKKLNDYLPSKGEGSHRQFVLCRYIINGTDKASAIADLAVKFQAALKVGGWA